MAVESVFCLVFLIYVRSSQATIKNVNWTMQDSNLIPNGGGVSGYDSKTKTIWVIGGRHFGGQGMIQECNPFGNFTNGTYSIKSPTASPTAPPTILPTRINASAPPTISPTTSTRPTILQTRSVSPTKSPTTSPTVSLIIYNGFACKTAKVRAKYGQIFPEKEELTAGPMFVLGQSSTVVSSERDSFIYYVGSLPNIVSRLKMGKNPEFALSVGSENPDDLKATLLHGAWDACVIASGIDDILFIIGGKASYTGPYDFDNTIYHGIIQTYNIRTREFRISDFNLTNNRSNAGCSSFIESKTRVHIYIGGGVNNSSGLNTVEEFTYDTSGSHRPIMVNDTLSSRRHGLKAVTIVTKNKNDSYIFFIGGYNTDTSSASNRVDVLQHSTKNISSSMNLTQARYNPHVVYHQHDKSIWVIGGSNAIYASGSNGGEFKGVMFYHSVEYADVSNFTAFTGTDPKQIDIPNPTTFFTTTTSQIIPQKKLFPVTDVGVVLFTTALATLFVAVSILSCAMFYVLRALKQKTNENAQLNEVQQQQQRQLQQQIRQQKSGSINPLLDGTQFVLPASPKVYTGPGDGPQETAGGDDDFKQRQANYQEQALKKYTYYAQDQPKQEDDDENYDYEENYDVESGVAATPVGPIGNVKSFIPVSSYSVKNDRMLAVNAAFNEVELQKTPDRPTAGPDFADENAAKQDNDSVENDDSPVSENENQAKKLVTIEYPSEVNSLAEGGQKQTIEIDDDDDNNNYNEDII